MIYSGSSYDPATTFLEFWIQEKFRIQPDPDPIPIIPNMFDKRRINQLMSL